jgi:hypothetical protein
MASVFLLLQKALIIQATEYRGEDQEGSGIWLNPDD